MQAGEFKRSFLLRDEDLKHFNWDTEDMQEAIDGAAKLLRYQARVLDPGMRLPSCPLTLTQHLSQGLSEVLDHQVKLLGIARESVNRIVKGGAQ